MTLLQSRKHQIAVAPTCLQGLPTVPSSSKLDFFFPPVFSLFYPQTKASSIEDRKIELSDFLHTSASTALHPGASPCCADGGRETPASVPPSLGEENLTLMPRIAVLTGEAGRPVAYSPYTHPFVRGYILRDITQGFPFSREHLNDSATW